MATWVALLRAVNLVKRNRVSMPELRRVLADSGYGDVRTVVASGNVVFAHAKPSAQELERLIAEAFGVRTTVLLRRAARIRALVAARPFPSHAYVAFLARKPAAAALRGLRGLDEHAFVGGDLVLHLPDGYANARLTGAVIEKRLATEATIRNWSTVEKLAALVGAPPPSTSRR